MIDEILGCKVNINRDLERITNQQGLYTKDIIAKFLPADDTTVRFLMILTQFHSISMCCEGGGQTANECCTIFTGS